MDRVSKLCVKAAKEALADAAYTIPEDEKKRVSVIMGSCVGGVNSVEAYYRNGEKAEDVTKMPISAIANEVAYIYGADGIVTNIANACAAGTISIAYACDLIRAGKCDVAIAGGADAFASVPYAGFLSLHALAENGCSPFNHCDGITLGEGSGVLIVDQRILPSLEVTVHGKKDIPGVIGIKPDRMLESKKTVSMKEMAIDTGLGAKIVKENIFVGDSITMAQSIGALGKKQWSGKTLDDRASVAAVIDVMKNIKDAELNADVYAVAAVQEEVGCRGGKTTAGGIRPDIAIAIDVTHGITPDNSDNAFEIGSGCAVSVGPNIHPLLAKALFKTAKKHNIKVTTEVCGGETGTDAWEMQIARGGGIPTALLSIPLKYMHTSVETLAISDVKATSKLLTAFIMDFRDMTDFVYSAEV